MALKKLLPVAGVLILWAPGAAQPPVAPAPRAVGPQIDNLVFRYRDMRTATPAEFDAWLDSYPTDQLPQLLTGLQSHRAELARREAIVRERIGKQK